LNDEAALDFPSIVLSENEERLLAEVVFVDSSAAKEGGFGCLEAVEFD
jgi:hypothetical protein